jgi:hypothetical protein
LAAAVARDSHTHREGEPAEHKHWEERIHTPDMKDSQDKAGSPAFVEDSPQMADMVDCPVPEVGCLASDRKVDSQDMQDEREAPLMDLRAMSLTHVHDE